VPVPSLDGEHLGETDDAVLAHVVREQAWELLRRVDTGERRDRDDASAVGHLLECFAATEERSGEVDVERPLPALGRDLIDRRLLENTRGADEDVELLDRLEQLRDLGR